MTGLVWIATYDRRTGGLSDLRRLTECGPDDGMPDGATVDSEGCLWSAFFGSGTLRRYAPDGALDLTLRLPVRKVTSLTFGGPNCDIIYVTSAGAAFPPDDGAAGGKIFRVTGLGVRGLPEPKFAG